MKKLALIIFAIASLGEVISQFVDTGWVHHLCKPLIMLSLGAYYLFSVRSSFRSGLVIGAIFFSFLGDSLLMYEQIHELYFMLGLGAFLAAQVFYALAYRQHRVMPGPDTINNVLRIRMAFPVVLAGTGLVIVLYSHLGELKFPVMVYALVLMLMVLSALFRMGRTSTQSFWLVFVGAVLFMVSDSLLAINKFLGSVPLAGFWIMTTYIAAQFFIIAGLLVHTESVDVADDSARIQTN